MADSPPRAADDQLGFLVRYRRHERSERRERVPVAEILRRALVLCQRREHRARSLRPHVRILLCRRHRAHQLGDSVEVLPVHDAAERLARVRAREPHQPQRQHPRRLIPGLLARRVLRGAMQRHLQDIRRFLRVLRPALVFVGFRRSARKLSTVIGVLAAPSRAGSARDDGDRARAVAVASPWPRRANADAAAAAAAGARVPLRLLRDPPPPLRLLQPRLRLWRRRQGGGGASARGVGQRRPPHAAAATAANEDEPRASWVKHLSATSESASASRGGNGAGSHSAKSARVWYGESVTSRRMAPGTETRCASALAHGIPTAFHLARTSASASAAFRSSAVSSRSFSLSSSAGGSIGLPRRRARFGRRRQRRGHRA